MSFFVLDRISQTVFDGDETDELAEALDEDHARAAATVTDGQHRARKRWRNISLSHPIRRNSCMTNSSGCLGETESGVCVEGGQTMRFAPNLMKRGCSPD